MSTNQSTLPSTIEIKPARVHVAGNDAGVIEVAIVINHVADLNCDLDELFLQLEGEEHFLRPAGRVYFDGGLQLTFFSRHVRKTNRLPRNLQLHWGNPGKTSGYGMELDCREAGPERE